jgi:cytochrome c2
MRMRRSTGRVLALAGGAAVLAGIAMSVWATNRAATRESREWASTLTGGNPELAAAHIARYGCSGCHTIPGIRGPAGRVGPPLGDVGERIYIAGVLTNTPDNLIRWIVDPPAIDPRTAMPVTGISEVEARDVAAYLYSLR